MIRSRAVYAAARAAMCFMLILSMLLGLCIAGHASQTTDGVSFEQTRLVASDRAFESVPLTFEAWVYVPKSQSGISAAVWILVGCVGAVLVCVCIVVSVNGAKKKKSKESKEK